MDVFRDFGVGLTRNWREMKRQTERGSRVHGYLYFYILAHAMKNKNTTWNKKCTDNESSTASLSELRMR